MKTVGREGQHRGDENESAQDGLIDQASGAVPPAEDEPIEHQRNQEGDNQKGCGIDKRYVELVYPPGA
jgi:hypothetical protein